MLKGQVSGDRVPPEFEALVQPHIESYDYFINEGMQLIVEQLEPVEVIFSIYLVPDTYGHHFRAHCAKHDKKHPILASRHRDLVCVLQIVHPVTKNVLRIWYEDPNLSRPIHSDVDPSSPMVKRLLPRECREAVRISFPSHCDPLLSMSLNMGVLFTMHQARRET